MLDELQAAIDYLVGALDKRPTEQQKANFAAALTRRLCSRFASNWNKDDGEQGSASRALHWHLHGGGEGLDGDLAATLVQTFSGLHDNMSSQYRCFASPFTMWIDPGCVAVRVGYGPGTYLDGISTLQQQQQATGLTIVYGAKPLSALPMRRAEAIYTSQAPPTVHLMPSTPALHDVESMGAGKVNAHKHSDDVSPAIPYNRQTALSVVSSRTCSSSGSILSSNDDASESCPSLVAPSSTRGDSDCEHEDDNVSTSSEMSIQDMFERRGFKNVDVIESDDEEIDSTQAAIRRGIAEDDSMLLSKGDDTVTGGFGTVSGVPPSMQKISNQQQPISSPQITNYDGGNVGVLGGGVRLGAVSNARSNSRTVNKPKPILVQPYSSWSNSPAAKQGDLSLPSPLHNTFYPTPSPTSAGFPTYTLSPLHAQSFSAIGQQPGSPYPGSPQFVIVDGCLVPVAFMKRARARGRRSRGRGAGRAARRQAAAAAAETHQGSYTDEADGYGSYILNEGEDGHDGAVPSALGISLSGATPSFEETAPAQKFEQYDAPAFMDASALARQKVFVPNKSFNRPNPTRSPFVPQSQSTPTQRFTQSPAVFQGAASFDPTMPRHHHHQAYPSQQQYQQYVPQRISYPIGSQLPVA